MSKKEERFEPVSIEEVTAKRETDKALLCVIEGQPGEFWIPKSQIHDDSEVYEEGGEGTLVIPRWLAEEKGIDY